MRSPLFFDVPAGLERSECDGCAKHVYWIRTTKGKRMPVDVDVYGGFAPTSSEPGRGWAHFATCPQAQRFRRAPAPVRERALRMAAVHDFPGNSGTPTLTLVVPGRVLPTPQPSLFESPGELLGAVALIALHSGVADSRILNFAEDARTAARTAMGRTFSLPAYNRVREAAGALERFHGERW